MDEFLKFEEWYQSLNRMDLDLLRLSKEKLFEEGHYKESVQFGRQWQERWKLKSEPGEFGPGWYNIDWFTVLELHSESPEAVRKLFMMPYSPEKVNADQGINPSLVALGEWMNSSHWVYLTKASPWMMGGALSIRFDTGKKLWLLEETEGPFQVALSGPGTRQFERAAKVVAKGMRAKKDETAILLQWIWAGAKD